MVRCCDNCDHRKVVRHPCWPGVTEECTREARFGEQSCVFEPRPLVKGCGHGFVPFEGSDEVLERSGMFGGATRTMWPSTKGG